MATQKKIAFITGANRGIGLETARELAEAGVHVLIGSRDQSAGEQAAAKLRAKGLDVESVRFDVTKTEDHRSLFELLQRRFGRLDILVNNAGVWLDAADASTARGNRTSTTPMEILRSTFDVNFFAPVALTQTLLPLLRASEAGRIVNLSSILASLTLHSDPKSPIYEGKAFAYDASKTALNAFTIHLAHELKGTKIKVNSAHPGWVKTEMGGENALMEVADGGKTSAELSLLPDSGPTGAFLHRGEPLPW